MGWGRYRPVFCRISAKDRISDPSFGSSGFTMHVYVGGSIKESRELVEIHVVPDISWDEPAKLFINGKLYINDK